MADYKTELLVRGFTSHGVCKYDGGKSIEGFAGPKQGIATYTINGALVCWTFQPTPKHKVFPFRTFAAMLTCIDVWQGLETYGIHGDYASIGGSQYAH